MTKALTMGYMHFGLTSLEAKCPACGKKFLYSGEWVFREGKKIFCSYHCYRGNSKHTEALSKICKECGIKKEISEFGLTSRRHRYCICKECVKKKRNNTLKRINN